MLRVFKVEGPIFEENVEEPPKTLHPIEIGMKFNEILQRLLLVFLLYRKTRSFRTADDENRSRSENARFA